MSMDEQFLTTDDLAQRWNVKKKTIYQLKGELPYYKFKGSIRFKLSDVTTYEENHKIEEEVTNGTAS
jgi:excisionase family DNA binding protein